MSAPFEPKIHAFVNPGLCMGCGTRVSVCPSKSADRCGAGPRPAAASQAAQSGTESPAQPKRLPHKAGFSEQQIYAELEALA